MATTGVCHRYGVDKSRVGVIGSVCYIPWLTDVEGLAMLPVSDGESSFYVLRGGIPFLAESLCLQSVSGHIGKRVASLDAVWVGCVAVLFLIYQSGLA